MKEQRLTNQMSHSESVLTNQMSHSESVLNSCNVVLLYYQSFPWKWFCVVYFLFSFTYTQLKYHKLILHSKMVENLCHPGDKMVLTPLLLSI